MTPKTSTEVPTPEVTVAVTSTLPAGLVPLLNQRQLEAYYGVSNWTVNQWIQLGMPIVPMASTGRQRQRRFDLAAVQRWHAERVQYAATA